MKPIIFSSPMVLAILEGRKTQTRRVIKPQPAYPGLEKMVYMLHPFAPSSLRGTPAEGVTIAPEEYIWCHEDWVGNIVGEQGKCPYGIPGDKLWVRETWKHHWASRDGISGPGIQYKADGVIYGRVESTSQVNSDKHWRPSTNMSRWASRLTLQIIDVRVEKLQEILYEDAVVEGIEKHRLATKNYNYWINYHPNYSSGLVHAQASFHTLWDYSINKKHEHRWGANPWVWVLEFEVVDE